MIQLEHIAAGYLPGQDIIKDASFTLERGSFHFLSGGSGAGKTTLLAMLGLIHRPSCGQLRMFGKDVTRLPRYALPKLRRRIGMVSQDYRLLPHLTVEENVGLALKVAGEPPHAIQDKVAEMLAWVGLKEYHRARPEVLSGGQQQRVAIARAVITKPDLLLADEPSGHLETALALRFMYLFEALNKMGTTVLLATHDDALISRFSHPVLQLKDGVVTPLKSSAPAAAAGAMSARPLVY